MHPATSPTAGVPAGRDHRTPLTRRRLVRGLAAVALAVPLALGAAGCGDDAAGDGRGEADEHQAAGAETAEQTAAQQVGDGDRQGEQAERRAGLALGDDEVGADRGQHRRQHLLAHRDGEVGGADEGERSPVRFAARRVAHDRSSVAYSMQSCCTWTTP